MADPFSTLAGAVSLVDILVRACKGVITVVADWKEAPSAIKRLQDILQSLQSLLEHLRLLVTEYESSELVTRHHQFIPDFVKKELLAMQSDIDSVQQLLPSPATRKTSQAIRWSSKEKRVSDLVRRLESRQIILVTGLQSLAQRSSVQLYQMVSHLKNDIEESNKAITEQYGLSKQLIESSLSQSKRFAEQANALEQIRAAVDSTNDDHLTLVNTMENLKSVVASTKADEDRLISSSTFEASTIDLLHRVLRTELRSNIVSLAETGLDPYKSSHERHLKAIRKVLDQVVADSAHATRQSSSPTKDQGSQTLVDPIEELIVESSENRARMSSIRVTPNAAGDACSRALDDPSTAAYWTRIWSWSRSFSWPIGTVLVSISTFHIRSRLYSLEDQAFSTDKRTLRRHAYRVTIEFYPSSKSLITKGLSMIGESRQDQRGYYEICPRISVFAIVPDESEVFVCVTKWDIEGLRRLFSAGLAAPTDRMENMVSLLHVATSYGSEDLCEFLLEQGADPFAKDCNENDSLHWLIGGSLCDVLYTKNSRFYSIENYRNIARILTRYSYSYDLIDTFEENDHEYHKLIDTLLRETKDPQRCLWKNVQNSVSDWITIWKEQGVDFRQIKATECLKATEEHFIKIMALIGVLMEGYLTGHPENATPTYQIRRIINLILIMCLFGVDVSAREPGNDYQAIHLLMILPHSPEISEFWADLAYILVHFGHADVSAMATELAQSPTLLAVKYGWFSEWIGVLKRCGIEISAVLKHESEWWMRKTCLGFGESSVIDTEDLLLDRRSNASQAMRKRHPIKQHGIDD